MKNKIVWILCVLILVYILQLVWVNLVIAFIDVFYNLSSDVQHLFLSVFFAPVMEEAMYRYAPLSIAKKYFPKSIIPVVVLSSIVFGLAHENPFPVNLLAQGALGLSFSYVYLKFGYKYAVLSHAMWNLGCFLNCI